MRIDFFENTKSQYQVLGHFTKGLQAAILRKQIQSKSLDPETATDENFASYKKDAPYFTAGFNFCVGDYLPFAELGIFHIVFVVDWITYYPELMHSKSEIVVCVDRHSSEYVRHFGSTPALFLPHAIEAEAVSEKLNDKILHSKRDLDVVFTGSFIDPSELIENWKKVFSPYFMGLLHQIVDDTLASDTKSHVPAILELFERDPKAKEEFLESKIHLFDLANSVEQLIRAYDRIHLLNAVSKHTLHIFGNKEDQEQWKKVLKGNTAIEFHDPVAFDKLSEVFQRAKVVLSSVPMFKEAFHERIFYALANGASVVTNKNYLLPRCFPENFAIQYFLSPAYNKVNSAIDLLCSNEEMRLDDVMKAREMIRKHHTWDVRADELLIQLKELHFL